MAVQRRRTRSSQTDPLLARRLQQLESLYAASLRLNSQADVASLLHVLLEQALVLLPAQAGGVFLFDERRGRLILSGAAGGLGVPLLDQALALAQQAFERRAVQFAESVPPDGAPTGGMALGVPLAQDGLPSGVLVLFSHTADLEQAAWLAEMYAAQASVALRNVQLYEEAQNRARERAALHRAGQAIAATLDMRQVLELVIAEVRHLVDAEGATVLLLDHEVDELYFAAAAGPDSSELRGLRLPASTGIAGVALRERRSILVEDVQRDPRFYSEIDIRTGGTTRSLIAVPLITQGTTEGVIEAVNKTSGAFGPRDVETLEVMANSAAVAIANARLYQAEREQFRRLQQSQAQLIQVEKMAAMGRLVSSIAHEINNPLQAVQGCLTLTIEELDSDLRRDVLTRYLGMAVTEIERIATIVRRVRDFYRPASPEMVPTDIHPVLDSLLDLMGKQLKNSNVRVERAWAGGLPQISANPSYLKQVFLNLVLNAIDAMAERGGTLRMRTSLAQMTTRQAPYGLPAVRIEVVDTGKGIPPEVMQHLFEPFVTDKKEGTGLGLSISYGLIEAHGGQISAKSDPGQGTTFTILLPALI